VVVECSVRQCGAVTQGEEEAPQRMYLRRTLVVPPPQPASMLITATLSAVQPVPYALEVRTLPRSRLRFSREDPLLHWCTHYTNSMAARASVPSSKFGIS
jgi:hypothetical protein